MSGSKRSAGYPKRAQTQASIGDMIPVPGRCWWQQLKHCGHPSLAALAMKNEVLKFQPLQAGVTTLAFCFLHSQMLSEGWRHFVLLAGRCCVPCYG